MKVFATAAIGLLLLSAPALAQDKAARTAKGEAFAATKAAVAKVLKDPQSATYSSMARAMRPNARGAPTDTVCGTVNAKNSFGGYTGARPFVHFVADNSVNIAGESDLDTTIVRNFCK